MAKTKQQPEPYWNELVEVYFTFCQRKFNEKPSFDGSSPRDLKNIIRSLKKRAMDAGVEWTYGVAATRLNKFLESAYSDQWLQNNFLLSNINRQKDKIFFNTSRQYIAR